ncbi:RNA methyltransferase [candidate division KSB1 bacterium]|nr:RNA methyltransferase [candidate division KSB1 bacterium]
MNKISHLDIIHASKTIDEIQEIPRKRIRVVLDNVRSLYNVGSIFRTSDAAGVEMLYLCGITGRPPRAEIHKAALGAENSVPWSHAPDSASVIRQLKREGYRIVVLEHTDSGVHYLEAGYQFPLCLVVGHEITGVADEAVSLADMAIEIPMAGYKQSLNVSVAYGIAIYHIISQYPAASR